MNKKLTHTLIIMMLDCLIIAVAGLIAMTVRFEFSINQIPIEYITKLSVNIPVQIVITLIVFYIFKMYHFIWHFVSMNDVVKMFTVITALEIPYVIGTFIVDINMPRSVIFMNYVFKLCLFIGMRCSVRLYNSLSSARKSTTDRIMIIGAGEAGSQLLREIALNKDSFGTVACIIDDNSSKWGKTLHGIPIVGGREEIESACKKYDISQIIFAIPAAKTEDRKSILETCNNTGIPVKALPGMTQIYNGEVSIKTLRDVDIEDLLGRDTIKIDTEGVGRHLRDKVVMVTGGGGSIGSELCRQIASFNPKRLVIVDIYENNAYEIQQELKRDCPTLNLETRILSVRDSRALWKVMDEFRPEVLYHAAAHKHVPLMEDAPCEAIKNNAIGTYKTAYAAMVFGCERFVLISTDKAVNPTNIMGASKRLCEMVIQSFDAKVKAGKANEIPQLYTHHLENSLDVTRWDVEWLRNQLKEAKTEFVAVRFGNVLGSNGSVIPLFKKQIAKGGPVTVTHPDIIRYFMTIPEAVSLVLQAGTYAKGGEIFVLDMGEPVKIDTLARNLIRLSGHKPDVDIKIEYTGLRPGEKLYEEKLMDEEGMTRTENDLIQIGKPISFNTDVFLVQLDNLMKAAYDNSDNIVPMVVDMVDTFVPGRDN